MIRVFLRTENLIRIEKISNLDLRGILKNSLKEFFFLKESCTFLEKRL